MMGNWYPEWVLEPARKCILLRCSFRANREYLVMFRSIGHRLLLVQCSSMLLFGHYLCPHRAGVPSCTSRPGCSYAVDSIDAWLPLGEVVLSLSQGMTISGRSN